MKIYGFDDQCNICGRNIRRIRTEKRITQTDLAARLQIQGVQMNQNSICRIERGKRVVADYELLFIAAALSVPVATLLELPVDREPAQD